MSRNYLRTQNELFTRIKLQYHPLINIYQATVVNTYYGNILGTIIKDSVLIALSNTKGDPLKCPYGVDHTNDTEMGKKPRTTSCSYSLGQHSTHDFGLVRLESVMKYTTLSKSTIYRRMGSKTFPERVNVGGNIAAWRLNDIAKFVNGEWS